MPLDRYRPIIPDFDRFLETISRPEPTTIRVRTGRITPEDLAERLRAQGFETESVQGQPDFLEVVRGPRPVSITREHWHGMFYVQQAVTGLAAPVLAPAERDRVLDLCAAPGGKSAHLAELMGGRGCVVAADVNEGRLKSLMGNLTRLLLPNVIAVVADGRRFPGGARFDRILVDAPCSGEGNLRKRGGTLRRQRAAFLRRVTRLQERILRRGIALLRPGGSLLYVTCTFAPEENEAVVSRVLADSPVRVEPFELPVPSSPGLARFGELTFDPDLEQAHRLYPHHLDSGGLFMALLKKEGAATPTPEDGWTAVPPVFPGDDRDEEEARTWTRDGLRRLVDQFGAPAGAPIGVSWMTRADNAWMHTCDAWPVSAWNGGDWRISAAGLRGLSPGPRGRARPTNNLIRLLDDEMPERRIGLTRDQAIRVLRREPVAGPPLPPGFVTLALDGTAVGRASFGKAGIRHELGKARGRALLAVLERERQEADVRTGRAS